MIPVSASGAGPGTVEAEAWVTRGVEAEAPGSSREPQSKAVCCSMLSWDPW